MMPANHLILCRPPSPPAFNLSPNQDLFQRVSSSHQMSKVLELQLQHQSFQWIFRVDFLQDWLICSSCHLRDSQETSPTPYFKSINSSALSLLYGPTLTPIYDYWKKKKKTHNFGYMEAKWCLCFLMCCLGLSSFLSRNRCLLISWLQSPSTVILEPKNIKSVTASTFSPSTCHDMMGPDAMILVFLNIEFQH